MSGDVLVRGNANPGPDDVVKMSGPVTVTGSTTPASDPFAVPTIDVGNAATVNDNDTIGLTSSGKDPVSSSPDFSLSGNDTITLNSGTYYFQSFSISGGSTVVINPNSGPITIYVTNSLSISGGGLVNQGNVPSNLRFYVTGSSVSYSGNSDFYGVIVAPDGDLSISGDADFFGSLIAKKSTMSGNSRIHYDEALETTDVPAIAGTVTAFLGG